MLLKEVLGLKPKYGKDCYFAKNATLIGDLVIGKNCSVWFQVVIRGDVNSIRIGDRVNIQDGAVIHATYKKSKTIIGSDLSIGHNSIIHGCTIKSQVLIGMGSIIMDDYIIEENSIIAAGCVLPRGTIVKSGSVYGGIPGKKIKSITDKNITEIKRIARSYITYSSWYQ